MNMEDRHLQTLLTRMVDAERAEAVKPMLADRIVRQAREQGLIGLQRRNGSLETVTNGILGWFRPMVVVCLLALAVLVAYNIRLTTDLPGIDSRADRLLGLPSVTLTVAYDPDFENH